MNESCHAGLRLNDQTRVEVRTRMRSIKGHLDGVARMLDDDSTYCVDVLKQIKAVTGALDKVGAIVLRSHLRDHVVTAADRGDVDEIVEELVEILKYR